MILQQATYMSWYDLTNLSHFQAWNVNWETRHMMIQFEEENVVFSCLTADCKVSEGNLLFCFYLFFLVLYYVWFISCSLWLYSFICYKIMVSIYTFRIDVWYCPYDKVFDWMLLHIKELYIFMDTLENYIMHK